MQRVVGEPPGASHNKNMRILKGSPGSTFKRDMWTLSGALPSAACPPSCDSPMDELQKWDNNLGMRTYPIPVFSVYNANNFDDENR